MASPCEILVRDTGHGEAIRLASLAVSETRRIERTYSRYRDDNIVYVINHSNGAPIDVDSEMARLLDYSAQCYQLSEGLFDITSGILRKAWRFNGSEIVPDNILIKSLLENVGWDRVKWDGKTIRLMPGMEIDFGGIGKEYAVDIVAEMLHRESNVSLMVNFGGDIRAISIDSHVGPWHIGIDDPTQTMAAVGQIDLANGAVATSGDLFRYCIVNGTRMGHILNPLTGWPVENAPRAVTVLGDYCTEAGFLATLAILQGAEAESFLKSQNAQAHCVW